MTSTSKMTKREFYADVIATYSDIEGKELFVEYAKAELAKLDEANAARRAKTAEKRAEDKPLLEAVQGVLTSTPITATDIGMAIGVSTQKATYLAKALVEEGIADSKEVKVKGKRAVKGYFLVTESTED